MLSMLHSTSCPLSIVSYYYCPGEAFFPLPVARIRDAQPAHWGLAEQRKRGPCWTAGGFRQSLGLTLPGSETPRFISECTSCSLLLAHSTLATLTSCCPAAPAMFLSWGLCTSCSSACNAFSLYTCQPHSLTSLGPFSPSQ